MSDYMVYWKYYWRDAEVLGYSAHTFEWHTRNENIFYQLEPGDDIWVIVRAGLEYPTEWRLLMRIRIGKLEIDLEQNKYWVQEYGTFHVIGDPENSEVFEIKNQLDFTQILKRLTFESEKKIQSTGALIGRSFQSARPLSEKDSTILKSYTALLEAIKPI